LAASSVPGDTVYYTFDGLGNTSEVTFATGEIANKYAYSPFGGTIAETEAIANVLQYVGEYGVTEEAAGLSYMRFRFYAQDEGRFLQADPLLNRKLSNSYEYAGNDPSSYIDPLGLKKVIAWPVDPTDVADSIGDPKFKKPIKIPFTDTELDVRGGNWTGGHWSGGDVINDGEIGDLDKPATDWADKWAKIHDIKRWLGDEDADDYCNKKATREKELRDKLGRGTITDAELEELKKLLRYK